MTAVILVKVNEHHTQCGKQYFQISQNYMSQASAQTTHADVLDDRTWESRQRLERKRRGSTPSPEGAAYSWGSAAKRAR